MPDDRALATTLPDSLTMTIRGSGWNLVNFFFSQHHSYTIDVNTVRNGSKFFPASHPRGSNPLPSNLTIVETIPSSITIQLEERITKRVPVTPVLQLQFRQGFGTIGTPTLSPESIDISGARSILSGLREWRTMPISMYDINTPIRTDIHLSDTLPFVIERPPINITVLVDVQPIAERTIEDIPIDILQVPEHRTVVLIPPKVSIIIRSGVNTVSGQTRNDFQAFIDYRSILLDTSGWLKPTIIGKENVQVVQLEPERVQYVIRK